MLEVLNFVFNSRHKFRDKVENKLDRLDRRIDDLSVSTAKMEETVTSLKQVLLANQELFEQKLNNSRASQENFKEILTLKLAVMEDWIKHH